MKKLLIPFLLLISVLGFGQTIIDPAQTPTTARINAALSDAVAASGTDTYTGTKTGLTNITDRAYSVKFTNANTGSATFNLNGGGAVTIRKFESGSLVNLVAGDISAGETKRLRYNGTYLVIEGGSGGGPIDASDVTFTPVGTISATDVQAMGAELDTEKQPTDSDLTTIAGLSPSNDDFLQRKSGSWANRTVAQVKTDLGLTGTNSGDQTATTVPNTPAGNIAATTVQGAINELDTEKQPSISNISFSTNTLSANILGNSLYNLNLGAGGLQYYNINKNGLHNFLGGTIDGSNQIFFNATPGTYINATASTELTDFSFNANREIKFATGNFDINRTAKFFAPILSANGASTLTTAASLAIIGAPLAGDNMTIGNSVGLYTDANSLFDANIVEMATSSATSIRHLVLTRYGANTNGGALIFKKTRGATYSALSAVSNGDVLMNVITAPYSGTQYLLTSQIKCVVNGTVASGSVPTDMQILTGTNSSPSVRATWFSGGNFVSGSTSSSAYRTTNGGSDVISEYLIDPASSLTSGRAFSFDATNGFVFTQANGTRRIASGAIRLVNPTTTAGSEAADLGLFTQSAGGAMAQRVQIGATTTTFSGNITLGTAGNKINITEGSNGSVGQTTLVSGTKAITVSGVTTSSRCTTTFVSIGGTVTTTWQYGCVCTANTVTITALTNAGTTNTSDTSVLNYLIIN